jgi:predicted nucleotidyltransferase
MRISKTEQEALDFALNEINSRVFLFGSRTYDNRKGGDIDILVYSKDPAYNVSKNIAVKFFSRCESKIDVFVVNPDHATLQQQAFIKEQNLVPIK